MRFKQQLLHCMLLLGISVHAQQQPTAKSSDSVSVAPGVQLETKDWGGSGRTVVLLAGLGGTLHAYDAFAPRLTSKFHVIGLTRRGYGTSSHPDPVGENYDADRYQSVPLSIR